MRTTLNLDTELLVEAARLTSMTARSRGARGLNGLSTTSTSCSASPSTCARTTSPWSVGATANAGRRPMIVLRVTHGRGAVLGGEDDAGASGQR